MSATKKEIAGKPNVLIILNRFVIGGQAVDTIPLAWRLQHDFNILLLYGEKEDDEIEPAFLLSQYPGLRLKKIPSLRRSVNPFSDAAAFAALVRHIRQFRPHIVHTHGAKSGSLGRLAAFVCRVPVIIHTFHGHFFHSYFTGPVSTFILGVERLLGRLTTAAIALSEVQKKDLCEVFKVLPSSKLQILPLGFSASNDGVEALRNSFRQRYGLRDADVAIGIVGRIVPVKNHLLFIDVIKKLLAGPQSANAAFFIIGDGHLRRSLEHALDEEKISYSSSAVSPTTRVVFTSWLTNIPEVMSGLDIVALTSLNEGTPLSVIEAQFFKRPVVATNVGGVSDTMSHGRTGFTSSPGDTATFTNNLRLLLGDPALRTRMGEEGNRFVSAKFSKEAEIKSTKNFYFQLLHQQGFTFG